MNRIWQIKKLKEDEIEKNNNIILETMSNKTNSNQMKKYQFQKKKNLKRYFENLEGHARGKEKSSLASNLC